MDDLIRAAWKGETDPDSFPHRCPYRPNGMRSKQECIELSGQLQRNGECCGTQRFAVKFDPCNSSGRRCRVCVSQGRTGLKANAVVNIEQGTCEEHSSAPEPIKAVRPQDSPAKPEAIRVPPVEKTSTPEAALPYGIDEEFLDGCAEKARLLTGKMLNLFRFAGQGKDNFEIAQLMGSASEGSISTTMSLLFSQLGLRTVRRGLKRSTLRLIYERYLTKLQANE